MRQSRLRPFVSGILLAIKALFFILRPVFGHGSQPTLDLVPTRATVLVNLVPRELLVNGGVPVSPEEVLDSLTLNPRTLEIGL